MNLNPAMRKTRPNPLIIHPKFCSSSHVMLLTLTYLTCDAAHCKAETDDDAVANDDVNNGVTNAVENDTYS